MVTQHLKTLETGELCTKRAARQQIPISALTINLVNNLPFPASPVATLSQTVVVNSGREGLPFTSPGDGMIKTSPSRTGARKGTREGRRDASLPPAGSEHDRSGTSLSLAVDLCGEVTPEDKNISAVPKSNVLYKCVLMVECHG